MKVYLVFHGNGFEYYDFDEVFGSLKLAKQYMEDSYSQHKPMKNQPHTGLIRYVIDDGRVDHIDIIEKEVVT